MHPAVQRSGSYDTVPPLWWVLQFSSMLSQAPPRPDSHLVARVMNHLLYYSECGVACAVVPPAATGIARFASSYRA
jgi:hypothetical protein